MHLLTDSSVIGLAGAVDKEEFQLSPGFLGKNKYPLPHQGKKTAPPLCQRRRGIES